MARPYRIAVLGAALSLGCLDSEGEDTAADTDSIPRGALSFALPLADPSLMDPPVMGVDHDPEVYDGVYQAICADFLGRGFPHCYDEHDGSDFLLDGGFDAMDAGSVAILAAADGTVVETDDGHYDRCHADLGSQEVDCDGYPMAANYVVLEHESGWRTLYWHMKTDSVTVALGQTVSQGDALGLVGSSGNSATPHLHFQLEALDGTVIDPFAGPLSQPETWWCEQGDPEGLPGGC
jgi:murein DD-endopeptidase MepM/ murein hydrolase activator NlpD